MSGDGPNFLKHGPRRVVYDPIDLERWATERRRLSTVERAQPMTLRRSPARVPVATATEPERQGEANAARDDQGDRRVIVALRKDRCYR